MQAPAHLSRPHVRVVVGVLALLGIVAVFWSSPLDDARDPSWETLIHPLAPGAEVYEGYRLSPPRRGAEHDIVFTVRRAAQPGIHAAHVEVHVVDRGRWRA